MVLARSRLSQGKPYHLCRRTRQSGNSRIRSRATNRRWRRFCERQSLYERQSFYEKGGRSQTYDLRSLYPQNARRPTCHDRKPWRGWSCLPRRVLAPQRLQRSSTAQKSLQLRTQLTLIFVPMLVPSAPWSSYMVLCQGKTGGLAIPDRRKSLRAWWPSARNMSAPVHFLDAVTRPASRDLRKSLGDRLRLPLPAPAIYFG